MTIDRREFMKVTGAAALGLAAGGIAPQLAQAAPQTYKPATRWRGFNLLAKFTLNGNKAYTEQDFAMMAEWGFNFARLPMDYRCWTEQGSGEQALKDIDQAVAWGKQYGVHVNMNFHRAPGYCVNPPKEQLDLWNDPKALDLCAAEWRKFAERYKGIPNECVSFDLLNEPADCGMEKYERVARRLVQAIREADPKRLIMADGYKWGSEPMPALADLGIWQSTRGYRPHEISHYQASWVKSTSKTEPAWPARIEYPWKDEKSGRQGVSVELWDAARLRKEVIAPWKELEKQGVNVIVGEFGCFNKTPHAVALGYLGDYLKIWKEAGWGWALWELRGSFGVLDSHRRDVQYEDYKGRKLDRKMLELLQQG